MSRVRHLLTSFIGGEISPFLSGRIDSDNYRFGLETCENFLPTIEGPLVKRPGFYRIAEAGETSAWLEAFRFSATQEYLLELGEETCRFFTNGGRIETGGEPYEIATPYAVEDLATLSLQQNFDRLYIAHPGYPPGAIKRTGATVFAHETLELRNGPFADTNSDEAVTVTVSAATGTGITISASAAIFSEGDVGSPFRIEANDFSDLKAWEPQMKGVEVDDEVRNDGKAYRAAAIADGSDGKTGQQQPTHTRGAEWDGIGTNDVVNDNGPFGVQWEYLYDTFGLATITAVGGGGSTATATVTRRFPDSLTSTGSDLWAKGAFGEGAGWPGLVAIYKGRLIFIKDFDVLGSVVGDYGGGSVNFASFTDSGTLADDLAFRRRFSTEQVPHWIVSDKKQLLLGTAQAEISIGPNNPSEAFSGQNISSDPQSYYGSEPVRPVQAGTETVFVERGGLRLRSADYDFARDRYDAPDLTAAAGHILAGGVVQLTRQRVPYQLLYAVRQDGQLVVHPRTRIEIKGLSRFMLGGGARVVSAMSIIGEDGRRDELWALVERENGAEETVREIWRQAPWRELGDAQQEQFFVDGGIRIEASAGQTVFSGLYWLAGQDVAVLAAGGVIPGMSVSEGGVLTIPAGRTGSEPFTLIVGLAYTALAVTLPSAIDSRSGNSRGVRQKIFKVFTRVLETVGIKVGTPGFDPVEVIDRNANEPMDAPIGLRSEDVGGEVEADYDREGRATWLSEDPVGAIVTMAALKMEVDFEDA